MTADDPDWQAWFDGQAARLLLYARQWLPDRADAEDAVQAGFVKFWRHRPRPAAADLPLLFVAVRSAALDLVKARSRRVRRETQAADTATDAWWDADGLVERERAAAIQSAMGGLSPEQREAVTLRIWGGLTFAEIARVTGVNQHTVASRFRQALARLETTMTEACRGST